MKVTAIFKFNFRADYWPFTTEANPLTNEDVKTYGYDREIQCIMVSGAISGVTVMTRESLQVGSILRNMRDTSGNAIEYFNEDLYLQASEPQFNSFGQLEGWRHTFRGPSSRRPQ